MVDEDDAPAAQGNGGAKTDGEGKEAVTLVLDATVLTRFKQAGEDWQTLINEALRAALADEDEEGA